MAGRDWNCSNPPAAENKVHMCIAHIDYCVMQCCQWVLNKCILVIKVIRRSITARPHNLSFWMTQHNNSTLIIQLVRLTKDYTVTIKCHCSVH